MLPTKSRRIERSPGPTRIETLEAVRGDQNRHPFSSNCAWLCAPEALAGSRRIWHLPPSTRQERQKHLCELSVPSSVWYLPGQGSNLQRSIPRPTALFPSTPFCFHNSGG